MDQQAIDNEVQRRLDAVEQAEDVVVLFACESGSRAWGFASADSDFDVRFIYARRPDWYLSIDLEQRRDVIETPIEDPWDVNGWDLRKALQLLRKSNPPLLEWLQSPIVYREHSSTARRMRDLLPELYSARSSHYHYLHMARKNFREYLRGDIVRRKKYFYVLRPLLACRWIEAQRGAVPMEFATLVKHAELERSVTTAIEALLEEKRSGGELSRGPRISAISEFIEAELDRHDREASPRPQPSPRVTELNELFRETLKEVWR